MIGLGVSLITYFFMAPAGSGSGAGFNVPDVPETAEQPSAQQSAPAEDPNAPEDTTLTLTVPGMERLDGVDIPSAAGSDHQALRDNAGIHLEGTGFPWEDEANVYIAGHRLGYPTTDSFLAFYDQDNLEAGDEIYVSDSNGTEYTYEIFEEMVVGPTETYVTQPEPGRNILTLQTCTLPDYSERIIHRAELVSTT